MDEVQPLNQSRDLSTWFDDMPKKYYGYVINISRDQLDQTREKNGVSINDFIDILIRFGDENRIIRMGYAEFKRRLLS